MPVDFPVMIKAILACPRCSEAPKYGGSGKPIKVPATITCGKCGKVSPFQHFIRVITVTPDAT